VTDEPRITVVAQFDPSVPSIARVVDGDVREPSAILGVIASGIDLSQPACLIMGYLLDFSSPQAARDLVAAACGISGVSSRTCHLMPP
jgi:O-methyltransferase involved in polyketide biosynthesis